MIEKSVNKDLVLRERLALQRTILANQSTFLAYLRTALYFFIAGLSLKTLLNIDDYLVIEVSFFVSSFLIFLIGIINYFRQKKMIKEGEKQVDDYKDEYYK